MKPAGNRKPDNRKIRQKYICSCNPNEVFHSKTGRCQKCKEMCLTADAYRVKEVVDSGLNSPATMVIKPDTAPKKRKPVKLECDM